MKVTALLLPALLAGSLSAAQARDIYCDVNVGGSTDKVRQWTVVNSKVRKPQLPGSTKPSIGCSINFNSVGGIYRPIEIVTKPKLGEARTNYNTLFYRSAKNGEDYVAIRMNQVTRNGGTESLIFKYRITVIDRPI